MLQHAFGNIVIGDDTILQGTYGNNVARSAPDHAAGGFTHSQHAVGILLDGNDRWLLEDYSFTLHIDQDAGRPQVYAYIHGKKHQSDPFPPYSHLFKYSILPFPFFSSFFRSQDPDISSG